jgi:hypothetical protein
MDDPTRAIYAVILVLLGIASAGFGVWYIAKGRLPAWMKGIWRWPMGDNLTHDVVRALGWASLLVAAACPPTILMLTVWNRSPDVWLASMAAMFLVGAASFALVWSVVLSRRAD